LGLKGERGKENKKKKGKRNKTIITREMVGPKRHSVTLSNNNSLLGRVEEKGKGSKSEFANGSLIAPGALLLPLTLLPGEKREA